MSTDVQLERFVSINESDPDSTISSIVDWPLGLIRVVSTGFWSVRQAEEHFADYRRWVERIHDSGLALSLIVDTRAAPPQSQATSEVLRRSIDGVHRAGDRCAIIVAQSIAKLQLRRVLPAEYYALFVSAAAAETWALAYKRPSLAPFETLHICDGRA